MYIEDLGLEEAAGVVLAYSYLGMSHRKPYHFITHWLCGPLGRIGCSVVR